MKQVEIDFKKHLEIWLMLFLPVAFVGLFVVAWMLVLKKDMTLTKYGNAKYPVEKVDNHYEYPANGSFWKRWVFYAIRNPISNYGHTVLAIYPPPYEYKDFRKYGLTWNFGYKESGTFKMRPRFN